MGQRLNIEITNGEETLANCYYHWGAYTSSAITTTQEVLSAWSGDKPQDVHLAVQMLVASDAGFTKDEQTEEWKDYPLSRGRNEGLISVDPKGIADTRNWEEGRVTIDLADQTVNFEVLSFYENKDEFEEQTDESFDEVPVRPFRLDLIPFAEFDQFVEDYKKIENYAVRPESNPDMVISFIE